MNVIYNQTIHMEADTIHTMHLNILCWQAPTTPNKVIIMLKNNLGVWLGEQPGLPYSIYVKQFIIRLNGSWSKQIFKAFCMYVSYVCERTVPLSFPVNCACPFHFPQVLLYTSSPYQAHPFAWTHRCSWNSSSTQQYNELTFIKQLIDISDGI